MKITPEQADQWAQRATDGQWEHYDDYGMISLKSGDQAIATDLNEWDADLIAAAPDLAQTIAGMREEWAVEMYHDVDDTWRQYTTWVATREGASQHLAVDGYRWGQNYRLVRRLVGPVEVTE